MSGLVKAINSLVIIKIFMVNGAYKYYDLPVGIGKAFILPIFLPFSLNILHQDLSMLTGLCQHDLLSLLYTIPDYE